MSILSKIKESFMVQNYVKIYPYVKPYLSRTILAIAFLKNAPIVILDEATSALDNKSEEIVQQAIYNLMRDRTVFIIAHRLSTVKNADLIVVIDHGKIREQGTHDELLAKENSVYASLYRTQLK